MFATLEGFEIENKLSLNQEDRNQVGMFKKSKLDSIKLVK